MDRNCMVQDRKKWQAVVKAVKNIRVQYNSWNLTSGGTVGFSRTLLNGVMRVKLVDGATKLLPPCSE